MMSAPLARTSSGRMALTVAAVPTGIKAGVRISPRCMAMVPLRAPPSVAEMVKAMRVIQGGRLGADMHSINRGERGLNSHSQYWRNQGPEPNPHARAPILRAVGRNRSATAVAEAVEAIAGLDRVGVRRFHDIEPHQRADQDEQRRARQMEVGNEPVDRPEAVAGRDEDGRVAFERTDRAVLAGGALEQAQAGR